MTEEERMAYLAGIIDGEGTIAIDKKKHKGGRNGQKYYGYEIVFSAPNTSYELISWLKKNFGGNITTYKPEGRRPYWRWQLANKQKIKELLKGMRPYLIVKGKQADLALEYSVRCNYLFGRRGVPLWLNKRREGYHLAMKALHHE